VSPSVSENPLLSSHRRSGDWDLPEEPSPLRHPARLLAVVGAATAVVGVLMPWLDYGSGKSHASTNGLTGDTWGIFVLATAGALVAVLASRSAARSGTRWIQLLPAFLGFAGLVIYYDAYLALQQLADSYRASGDSVSFTIGPEILLLGVLLCAAGGLASSVVAWRGAAAQPRSGAAATAAAAAGPGAGFVAELALGTLVSLGCAIAGGVLALDLTSGNGEESGLIAIFSVLGVLVGATMTHALWRLFGSRR